MQTLSERNSSQGEPIYIFDGQEYSFVTVSQMLTSDPSEGFTIAGWISPELNSG